MKVEELLRELCSDSLPEEALDQAMARPEEVTPALLDLLSTAASNPSYLEENYAAVVCALYLLAAYRCREATGAITALLGPGGASELLNKDDFLYDDLSRILTSIFQGDFRATGSLVENREMSPWFRAAALDSLSGAVFSGTVRREDVCNYCRRLFDGALERDPSEVWGALITCCLELHLDELTDEIRQAYEEKLVDTDLYTLEAIEEEFAEPLIEDYFKEDSWPLIDDPVAELWPRYEDEDWDEEEDPLNFEPEWDDAVLDEESDRPVTEVRVPKIGRNQPCPCGSGKKHKKCCGK